MKIVHVLLMAGIAGTAQATELNYSQLELAYQSTRIEAAAPGVPDWRPRGAVLSGTWPVGRQLFLLGEGVLADYRGTGFGSLAAGAGIHVDFSRRFNLLATMVYKTTQQESNGIEAAIGVRTLPVQSLELFAAAGYHHLHGLKVEGDGDSYGGTFATTGLRYYLIPKLAVGADLSWRERGYLDSTMSWRAVIRYDFGTRGDK